jgi:hypothetical protein
VTAWVDGAQRRRCPARVELEANTSRQLAAGPDHHVKDRRRRFTWPHADDRGADEAHAPAIGERSVAADALNGDWPSQVDDASPAYRSL